MRVVSFFGSFGSAIERNKSGKLSSKNRALSPGKYNPCQEISLRASDSGQQIVAAATGY
jgi:hypothetical protein